MRKRKEGEKKYPEEKHTREYSREHFPKWEVFLTSFGSFEPDSYIIGEPRPLKVRLIIFMKTWASDEKKNRLSLSFITVSEMHLSVHWAGISAWGNSGQGWSPWAKVGAL